MMKRNLGKNGTRTSFAAFVVMSLAMTGSSARAVVWYVDQAATGPGHDGLSWCTAFLNPSEALEVAVAGDTIRVANGIYTPDPTGLANPREATFALVSGTALEGGYAGCGATYPDTRRFGLYESILSGDLNGDDGPTFSNIGENAFHVVTAEYSNPDTFLSGFTVTAGNAYGFTEFPIQGAGLLIDNASPNVQNCKFVKNAGSEFGGGAAVSVFGGFPYDEPVFRNCIIAENKSWGVRNFGACGFFLSCEIRSNLNGGMLNKISDVTLINCLIHGNQYTGVWNEESSQPFIRNKTISFNHLSSTAGYGGAGMANGFGSIAFMYNCILWGNSDDDPNTDVELEQVGGFPPLAQFTNWQGHGADSGIANIDADPLFVDPDGADQILGTADDDLRLQIGSPCIDAANNSSVPAGVDTDLDGHERFLDGDADGIATVDMGPYETSYVAPPIPTVSQWGLVVLSLTLLAVTKIRLRNRSGAESAELKRECPIVRILNTGALFLPFLICQPTLGQLTPRQPMPKLKSMPPEVATTHQLLVKFRDGLRVRSNGSGGITSVN